MNKMISSISNYINAIPKKSTFTLMSILLAVSNSVFAADCKTSMSYVKVVSDIPPTLKINPNVPIGGVMASGTYRTGSGPLPNGCTMYGPTTGYLTGVGTPNGNVYPTNLPYVGYKIMALGGNYISSKFYNKYWPITVSTPEPYLVIGTVQSFNFKFELIKLGTITADTPLVLPVLGHHRVTNRYGSFNFMEFTNKTSFQLIPESSTCTVLQSAISVTLNDVNQNDLNVMGKTAKDTNFQIPVNCKEATNISLSFSGDVADSVNGVFRNSNAENAENVGVQILDNVGNPVPTALGSYKVIGTVNGTLNYPMTARYYALTNNVSAGKVNAIANVTILYN
ncbi:fimbrial protein [Klebsiella michiganensis]|uniref:fimbrial protein n=1 Tax=Klebsiella TaxID=570 RepID=UPI001CED5749|nr:fimbrial protein [Klebsiella michiganensis]